MKCSSAVFKNWFELVALKQRHDLRLQPSNALDALQLASHLGVIVWTAEEVPGLSSNELVPLQTMPPKKAASVTGIFAYTIPLSPGRTVEFALLFWNEIVILSATLGVSSSFFLA